LCTVLAFHGERWFACALTFDQVRLFAGKHVPFELRAQFLA
jgi:hypothetical protein